MSDTEASFLAMRLIFYHNYKQRLQEGLSGGSQCVGMGRLGWVKASHRLKYNHKNRICMVFVSNCTSFMFFWRLYEWNVNVSAAQPAIEISLTHIKRSK